MELGENVVALNFQNLFHSQNLQDLNIFHHGKHKKKIAHLDWCTYH